MPRRGRAEQTSPAAGGSPRGGRRLWLILLVCLAGSAAASFVLFRYLLVPAVPAGLIGTWEVTEGDMRGATLQFTRSGTAVAVAYDARGGREVTNSAVEVDGDLIVLTTRDGESGRDVKLTQTIVRLTGDELVIRDEDGHTYRMRRVGN